MVKTVNLTSFKAEHNALIDLIRRKIAGSKIRNINEQINSKMKVEIGVLTEIFSSVEVKFRRCEMIFSSYLEDVDHQVLSGNSVTLPFAMDCTFVDKGASFQCVYSCDDKLLYKELIDTNFQSFILTMASIYENIVILIEIINRKVIVHTKEKTPISSPLHDYLTHLRFLIGLGYREDDPLNKCMSTFETYFNSYLSTINQLRNRFIHGYSINLSTDGHDYKVTAFDNKVFTPSSPDLNIDLFAGKILHTTRDFILDLYPVLLNSIKHHRKFVPA